MTAVATVVRDALERVSSRGESIVVEPEGFPLLQAAGIACPRFLTIATAEEARQADLTALRSPRVVVKIASPRILHRSDVGGVAIVDAEVEQVRAAIRAMVRRFCDAGPSRFTVSEFVPHHAGPGGELLLSLRATPDCGTVVTVGPGGVYAEALARHLRAGDEVAVFAADDLTAERVCARLRRLPFVQAVTGALRGQPSLIEVDAIARAVLALAALSREACPFPIAECEVNPLAVTPSGLVALDVLVRLGHSHPPAAAPRPLYKMASLLEPRTIAVAGVSEQMNAGHVILSGLLREGFPADAIRIIKPATSMIDGCMAVGSLADLPAPVDLLVLAVPAAHVPGMLVDAIENCRAESIIVIPGGLDEKAGGRAALAPVREALARARRTACGGPLINGGNCLGIRSRPGRVDTLFIPPYKLPERSGRVSPMALMTQSGAFAITNAGRLGRLEPKYLITVGNQMDLTLGDYLTWLADDESVRVFAVYAEGFRPGDGARLMRAARRITTSGRRVILYRAGRTAAGANASASHTASMAGDYVVTRELATDAGVLLVDSLEAFEDTVRVAVAFEGRRPVGPRLAALSNAGFECVAIADNLGPFVAPAFSAATTGELQTLLAAARIDAMVDIHNPLDLTPMAGDETLTAAARLILDDHTIDVGVIGCVPLTPALDTLPASDRHREDLGRAGAVAARLAELWRSTDKPWVVVVDAGPQYDPLVCQLEAAGIVTFAKADRALRALAPLCPATSGLTG